MALTLLLGMASAVSLKFDPDLVESTNSETTQSRQFTLKIDGKLVLLRTRYGIPEISEGNKVAVAGTMGESVLEAYAFRNLPTGACDYPAMWSAVIVAGILLCLGTPIVEHSWLGLIIVAAGVWTLWRALVARQTIQLLNHVPNASV